MHVKKQQLEPDMEQQAGSKLGKEYAKAVYCHPHYIIQNAGLDEAQAGIKIAGRNTNNLRWHYPYGRKWRTKEAPDESDREWKSWLKTQHSKN